jgi:hypothetical protein
MPKTDHYWANVYPIILASLPAQWKDLWNNDAIRKYVKSNRDLANRLKEMRENKLIKRVVDPTTDRILYVPRSHPIARQSEYGIMELLEKKRSGFDFDELYWGGQERGPQGWWKQVSQRVSKADNAMTRAINLWFEPKYGEKFRTDPVVTILNEMYDSIMNLWLTSLLTFYLPILGTSITGEKDEKEFRSEQRKAGLSEAQISRIKKRKKGDIGALDDKMINRFFMVNPLAKMWEKQRDFMALIALAIKEGYCSYQGVIDAVQHLHALYEFNSKAHFQRKIRSIDTIENEFLSELAEALIGDNEEKKAWAKQVLSPNPEIDVERRSKTN